jgi:uncharacterized protein YkwD
MFRILIFLTLAVLLALPLAVQPYPVGSAAVTAQSSPLEAAVNQARTANGSPALHIDPRLQAAAQAKIAYMVSSHCYLPRCVNEPGPYERQLAAGYPTTGFASELIDTEHTTVNGVMDYWMMDGSGNRFILLLASFTDLGCAYGMDGSTPLWVCDFGQQSYTVVPPGTNTPVPSDTPPPPTATPLPATATTVPATATTAPDEIMGECGRFWEGDDGSGAQRYGNRATRLDCLGF